VGNCQLYLDDTGFQFSANLLCELWIVLLDSSLQLGMLLNVSCRYCVTSAGMIQDVCVKISVLNTSMCLAVCTCAG
jgi:hypothetical protein